jgi:NMD protein affecting ribosome stability and mRNA decay
MRDVDHRGARTDKSPPVARKTTLTDSTAVCEHCGAVYARNTWRRGRTLDSKTRAGAARTTCPACQQVRRGEAFGKVVLSGSYTRAHEDAIRRRIENVAKRAAFTQPERQIVSIEWDRGGLEVLTTSEKLAHRIGREISKTFGGRAAYRWSDRDGSLLVTWEREEEPAAPPRRRPRR